MFFYTIDLTCRFSSFLLQVCTIYWILFYLSTLFHFNLQLIFREQKIITLAYIAKSFTYSKAINIANTSTDLSLTNSKLCAVWPFLCFQFCSIFRFSFHGNMCPFIVLWTIENNSETGLPWMNRTSESTSTSYYSDSSDSTR